MTARTIIGTRYTQADARDQAADFQAALASSRHQYQVLMFLHNLGYDVSQARVTSS